MTWRSAVFRRSPFGGAPIASRTISVKAAEAFRSICFFCDGSLIAFVATTARARSLCRNAPVGPFPSPERHASRTDCQPTTRRPKKTRSMAWPIRSTTETKQTKQTKQSTEHRAHQEVITIRTYSGDGSSPSEEAREAARAILAEALEAKTDESLLNLRSRRSAAARNRS